MSDNELGEVMPATTLSERSLHQLCTKSFLSYWSFPNPYRSQAGLAKELCDALVVCDKHILIFSDKDIGFPSGDLETAWNRWKSKSVAASVKQLIGARRHLGFPLPNIYSDHTLKNKIRVDLAPAANREIHLVAIANGATKASWEYFGDSISTLMLTNDPVTPDLFTLGDVNPAGEFVHVFTDASLSLVLREFDTLLDLVRYLSNRKKLFRSGVRFLAAGEEELIALYFRGFDENAGTYDMSRALPEDATEFTSIMLTGFWEDLVERPEYKARIAANHESYFWDSLIERFARHQIDGTGLSAKPRGQERHEGGLRYMALEPRVNRRGLVDGMLSAVKAFPVERNFYARSLITLEKPTLYVFVQFARAPGQQYGEYRTRRRMLLEVYAGSLLRNQPHAERVVGIATEPMGRGDGQYSEDLVLTERSLLQSGYLEEMERIKLQFSEFTKSSTESLHVSEFPPISDAPDSVSK